MWEFLLIIGAIIFLFLLGAFIRTRLSAKARWIVSSAGLIAFLAVVLRNGRNNFTTLQVIVLVVAAIGFLCYYFYKYKKSNDPVNKN